ESSLARVAAPASGLVDWEKPLRPRRSALRAVVATSALTVIAGVGLPLTAAYAAVGAPSHLSPNNTSVTANPVLRWAPASHALHYQVQVADNTAFNSPVYDVTTEETRATPPNELPVGHLFWRVRGIGASSSGAWTKAAFTKTAGAAPTLLGP